MPDRRRRRRRSRTTSSSWSRNSSVLDGLGRHDDRLAELAAVERGGGDLRAADVDADDAVAHAPEYAAERL